MRRFELLIAAFLATLLCALRASSSSSIADTSSSPGAFRVQTSLQLVSSSSAAESVIKETPLGPMRVSLSTLRARPGHLALQLHLQQPQRLLASKTHVLRVSSTIASPCQKQPLGTCTDTFVVSQARPYMTFPNAVARRNLDRLFSADRKQVQLQVDLQLRQLSGFARRIMDALSKSDADNGSGDSDTYEATGGLKNLRNTCYMNSALQLLFAAKPARAAVRDAEFRRDTPGAALKKLFDSMEVGVGDPVELARRLNINVMIQEDAHEFLLSLFAALQESSAHGLADNPAEEAYAGEMWTIVEGRATEFQKKRRRERYVGVSLDVEGVSSIREALQLFTAPQQVKNGEASTTTQTLFSTLPRVLLFQLKRFAYEPNTQNVVKLGHPVDVPLQLDMSPYVAPADEVDGNNKPQTQAPAKYTLQAAVIHTGEAQVGHYYVYVRPDPRHQPHLWIKYDDTTVQRVRWEQVEREVRGVQHSSDQAMQLFGRPTGSTTAYLVQYIRDDELAVVQ